MNAFGRMFMEPDADPPRYSMARLFAWPMGGLGFALSVQGGFIMRDLYWLAAGIVVLIVASALYTFAEWKRLKVGSFVSIERDDEDAHGVPRPANQPPDPSLQPDLPRRT